MMRFIIPIVLVGIGVAVFFAFTSPIYDDISMLRLRALSYNEALGNSKALENARDALTAKKNSIDPDNLLKLERLLPQSIDNIRLILEIEKIALPYGMALKDVKYNTSDTDPSQAGVGIAVGGAVQNKGKDYGVWDLEFSTVSPYNNFLNFMKDLESNLRIVDVSSITFSSATGGGVNPASPDTYKYNFKIKTYWLKN